MGRQLLLGAPIAFVAGCGGLLGIQTLYGTDAGLDILDAAPDSAPIEAGPTDAGLVDSSAPAQPDDGGCQIIWVDASGGAIPAGAVQNYPTADPPTFVCRVSSATDGLVPGKLLPGYQCYYGDGQIEQSSLTYQVLVPSHCSVAWLDASTLGVIDGNPLVCGEDSEGGVLFSCRIGQEGANPNELGHVGWSTDHICVYSLSGNALTSDIFQVLAVY
jgi:hypothetical protein